jgi:hypothetical protein
MTEENTHKHLNMTEEKTAKRYWIIGLVICAVIAILATIDLTGVWKKTPEAKVGVYKETSDAIFNFDWYVKMCDEVHIDSLGARVKVMQHSYNTETCVLFNDHHDCTVWRDDHFTFPKLAMMKGWENATKVTYDTLKYTYDSLGNATRVIKKSQEDGGYILRDRAVKYDSKGRVVQTTTTAVGIIKGKTIERSARLVKYKYAGDSLDEAFTKVWLPNGDTASRVQKCSEKRMIECAIGTDLEAKFIPTSVNERIYEEARNDSDRELWEKFEEKNGNTTVLKYCDEEDFSYEISKALPRSNYPGADTASKGTLEK